MTAGDVTDTEVVLRWPEPVRESRPLIAEAKEEAEDVAEDAVANGWVEV